MKEMENKEAASMEQIRRGKRRIIPSMEDSSELKSQMKENQIVIEVCAEIFADHHRIQGEALRTLEIWDGGNQSGDHLGQLNACA